MNSHVIITNPVLLPEIHKMVEDPSFSSTDYSIPHDSCTVYHTDVAATKSFKVKVSHSPVITWKFLQVVLKAMLLHSQKSELIRKYEVVGHEWNSFCVKHINLYRVSFDRSSKMCLFGPTKFSLTRCSSAINCVTMLSYAFIPLDFSSEWQELDELQRETPYRLYPMLSVFTKAHANEPRHSVLILAKWLDSTLTPPAQHLTN